MSFLHRFVFRTFYQSSSHALATHFPPTRFTNLCPFVSSSPSNSGSFHGGHDADLFSPSMGAQPPPSHLPPHHHHQSISLGPAAPPPPSSNGAPPTPSGPPSSSAAQATPKLPPTPSASTPYTTGPGGPGPGPGAPGPGQEGTNGVMGESLARGLLSPAFYFVPLLTTSAFPSPCLSTACSDMAGPQPYPPTPTATSSSAQEPPNSMAVTTLPPPPGSSVAIPPMPVDLSMDPQSVPPELKNEGADWFAIFNPAPSGPDGPGGSLTRKRNLDVQLVHTLMHER